jgi:predicted RecA/RadA family phage recombinase
MVQYSPRFVHGAAVTYKASAAVIGGRVVEVTGDRTVAHAGADSAKVVGVAGNDAAIGENVVVYSGGVQVPLSAGAIVAGAKVTAAAAGKVQTIGAGVNAIGVALKPAAAADAVVQIKFYA